MLKSNLVTALEYSISYKTCFNESNEHIILLVSFLIKLTHVGMPSSFVEFNTVELIKSSSNGFDQIRNVESADADTNVVSCRHMLHTESVWPKIERMKMFWSKKILNLF